MSTDEDTSAQGQTISVDMLDPEQVGRAMQLMNDNIVRVADGLRDLATALGMVFASSDASQGRISATVLLHALVTGDETKRPIFEVLRSAIENAPRPDPPDGRTLARVVVSNDKKAA